MNKNITSNAILKLVLTLSVVFLIASCTQVDPGNRGVKVTMGSVSDEILPEGLHFHAPFVTYIENISIKNESKDIEMECYSFENQPIKFSTTVRYRVPPQSVLKIFKEYAGDFYKGIIEPKTKESMMSVVSLIKTEDVIKKRDKIKSDTLKILKEKIGDLVIIDDFIISNDTLPVELEKAVSEKMVQEQKALKAKYIKDEEITKNEIVLLNAKAQAEANRLITSSITSNLIQYEFVKKSDGKLPLVMGSGASTIIDLNLSRNRKE